MNLINCPFCRAALDIPEKDDQTLLESSYKCPLCKGLVIIHQAERLGPIFRLKKG